MGQEAFLYYLGALGLGALHAFEPGHGKTLIASYMIGTRGRAADGILLGVIVTFTHTFSVIVLGIIAKLLSHSGNFTDQQLHGWLGLFSSFLILGVGIWMLKERLQGRDHMHFNLFGKGHGHDHDHAPGHTHAHHDHDHDQDHEDHDQAHDHTHTDHDHTHEHEHPHPHPHVQAQQPARPKVNVTSKWNLLVLGVSGGLVPCPAAITTLLVAIAAGRITQALTMALLFSLGLGLVMMIIGVILSQAGKLTQNLSGSAHFAHVMGLVSAVIITILGSITLINSIKSLSLPT